VRYSHQYPPAGRHAGREAAASPLGKLRYALIAVSLSGIVSAGPPDDPAQMGATQLRETAADYVKRGNFLEGVPVFEELIHRFGRQTEGEAGTTLETIHLFLGMGYLQEYGKTGMEADLERALRQFNETDSRFPGGSRRHLLHLFRADCYRGLGRWEEAARDLETALSPKFRSHLTADQSGKALENLVEALHLLREWERGIPWFRQLLVTPGPASRQARAATALTEAYVSTGQYDKIFSLLPHLSGNSPHRHDIRYNMKLLEGGDRLSEQGQYVEASLLYALTLTREELLTYWEARRSHLRKRLAQSEKDASKEAGETPDTLKVALENAGHQREALAGIQSYTAELEWRKARNFKQTGRNWEAFWAYWKLMEDYPEKARLYEDCHYAAFTQADLLNAFTHADTLANRYLDHREWTRYRREISVSYARLLLRNERHNRLIKFATDYIDKAPDDSFNPHLVDYLGSTYLRLERYEQLIERFTGYAAAYPDAPMAAGCHYWSGLAMLFTEDYGEAMERFHTVIPLDSGGSYREDSRFRIGVAHFARHELDRAEAVFTRFIRDYPDSVLRGEGELFLGDIASADARVGKAIGHYDNVSEFTGSMTFISHALFRKVKILEANHRHREMERTLLQYMNTYGSRGELAAAIFELGRAYELMGRPEKMLLAYLEAISKHGNDPHAHGLDRIILSYPEMYQKYGYNLQGVLSKPPPVTYRELHLKAVGSGKRTLALRLSMALDQLGHPPNPVRLFSRDDMESASPQTLVWIARRLLSYRNPSLHPDIRASLTRVLDHFPEAKEAVLEALMTLGGLAAESNDIEGSLDYYARAEEQFPASLQAVEAVLRQGDVLMGADRLEEAVKHYERVLKTRSWRGPAWAEAQYKIGLCHYQQERFPEAHAYFERTFIAFSQFREWSARAYLKDAETLLHMGAPRDARNTLREFLDTPEAEEAGVYPEIRKLHQSLL